MECTIFEQGSFSSYAVLVSSLYFSLFSFSFFLFVVVVFFREEHDLSSMQQKHQQQTIRKLYQPFLTPLAFVQYFNVYNHISLLIIARPPSAIGQPVLQLDIFLNWIYFLSIVSFVLAHRISRLSFTIHISVPWLFYLSLSPPHAHLLCLSLHQLWLKAFIVLWFPTKYHLLSVPAS